MILIKNAAPSKQELGAMYGLAQSCSAIARAISPAFVRCVLPLPHPPQINQLLTRSFPFPHPPVLISISIPITISFVYSSLFALSIEKNLLGGNLVWVVMTALAAFGVYTSLSLIDGAEVRRAEMEQALRD